jgi:hypothetical protein
MNPRIKKFQVQRSMIPPELISAAINICTIVSSLQTTKKGQETNLKLYYQAQML